LYLDKDEDVLLETPLVNEDNFLKLASVGPQACTSTSCANSCRTRGYPRSSCTCTCSR